MPTTILLVEDDPFNRDGVKQYLQRKGFEVIEAGDEATAWNLAEAHALDVAVIDIVIPANSHAKHQLEESRGARLALRLKQHWPSLGVVLFSAYGDRGKYIFDMMQRGVRGVAYKLKGCAPSDLLDAIKAVQSGQVVIDPEVTSLHSLAALFEAHLDAEETRWVKQAANHLPELTPREREVAQRIAASHKIESIAASLGLESKSVENYTNRIYRKLGLTDLAESTPSLRKAAVLAKAWMLFEFQNK